MFYFLTLIIPVSFVLLGYSIIKPKNWKGWVKVLTRVTPFLYLYTIFLYWLALNSPDRLGWEWFTLLFFLLPITLILLILHLITYFDKNSKSK